MKTSVRKIMIRTFVLAAIIWGIAYLLAAAATRLNLPPGLLRDGWDSLEAGVVAPLRSNWLAAAAAAVTFGFTIDQTGFPETVQDRLFPPRPDFLSWREEAGVGALLRRRIPIAGRDAELRRLRSWLRGRRTEHRVQAFGVYGARGIGKTRLILEAFRRLNPWWRLWRRWHVGVLTGPVPIGTRFRRPTAILVDYAVDAELFWRSAESLVRQHHEHPVRIVFESPVDFDKMVEGRAEHRTAPLRAILPRVTDAVDAPEGAAEPLRPGAQVSINPTTARRFLQLAPLDAASAKDLLTSAYGAFAPQRRRNRSWRAARARRTNAPAIIAAARGRPSYLLEFAVRAEEARPDLIATQPDLMRRTIDAWAVPREDAELLVEEAVSIFPEEGLELVLLAALGQGRKIPAEDRYEIAPGSGDRLRLSRLFRNYGEDEGVDADLLNEAPTIANAHVAHFAMMAILRRLQRADLQGFVKRVTRSESVALQAVQARLAEMLMAAWPPSDDSADPGLEDFVPAQMYGGLVAALLLLPEAAPLDVRRTVVERLQRPPFAPRSDVAESRRTADELYEALHALAHMLDLALASARNVESEAARQLSEALASHAIVMLDHARGETRSAVLARFASIAVTWGPEFSLLVTSPEWHQSESLTSLIGQIMKTAAAQGDLGWLRARLDEDAGDAPLVASATHERAVAVLKLMNREFGTPASIEWGDEERELVRELLAGTDPVGQMAATWAAWWHVRPTAFTHPLPVGDAVVEALVKVLDNLETPRVVWKRAAGALAKLCLPSADVDTDLLLSWARWADGNLTGEPELLMTAKPLVSVAGNLDMGIERALRILGDRDEPLDLRASAAMLVQACPPPEGVPSIAIDTLMERAIDPNLVRGQHETMVIRVAQMRSDAAANALGEFIRKQRSDVGITAFLALCAMGRLDLLDGEELSGDRYGREYLDAWRMRLRASGEAAPAAANTPEAPSAPKQGWFERRLITARGHLIHKLKAKDTTGAWAYYFVLVMPEREAAFLAAIEGSGTIDLEDYGRVIASCYGEEPTTEVRDYLYETYGFVV